VPHGQREESLQPYSRLSRPKPLLFFSSILAAEIFKKTLVVSVLKVTLKILSRRT
jgi:hypothetical protein